MRRGTGPGVLAMGVVLTACAGGAPDAREPGLDPLAPANLYPLHADSVWTYDIDTGTELSTLGIVRVTAVDGPRREVRRGEDTVVYQVDADGIRQPATGNWLLKAPIEEGAEWATTSDRVARVASVSVVAETPAGRFEGCVLIEETGGDSGKEIATTYCPGVGPVLIETRLALQLSVAPVRVIGRLRAYILGE